jgi:hypothetical protein
MIYGTEAHQAADWPVAAGAAAKRVCHRLFSLEQAAAVARVPVEQIWHWIMTRKLEAYRLTAGRVRIDEFELADLLSAR